MAPARSRPAKKSPVKKTQSQDSRHRYTVREKITAMKWCARKVSEEQWSQRDCARRLRIAPKSLRNWKKQYAQMLEYKKSALSMTDGPQSQLAPIADELLRFIFERREQGLPVSRQTVVLKASKLLPEFSAKTFTAKYAAVRRFLKKHDLVYRIGTHVSQKAPELATNTTIELTQLDSSSVSSSL
jgi:hypothetical protein